MNATFRDDRIGTMATMLWEDAIVRKGFVYA